MTEVRWKREGEPKTRKNIEKDDAKYFDVHCGYGFFSATQVEAETSAQFFPFQQSSGMLLPINFEVVYSRISERNDTVSISLCSRRKKITATDVKR